MDFATEATVTSSDPKCRALTLNLGPVTVDALVARGTPRAPTMEARFRWDSRRRAT
jgi:hypothetical protein